MKADVDERAAAIRHTLDAQGKEPGLARRYATVAARWEQLRIAQARGQTTPGDDTRMRSLAHMVQALGKELGFGEDIVDRNGFLTFRDPDRIVCKSWREAAEVWFG